MIRAIDPENDSLVVRGLKHAGFLLEYPRSQPRALRHARALANDSDNTHLNEFARWIESLDEGALDEAYADTFEIGAKACLYAGFHIFGLAYKRGVLLVTLKSAQDAVGIRSESNEVADHLALVLRLAAAYLAEGDPEGRGEALIEELVLPVTGRLAEGLPENDYGLLIRGLDEWLKGRWTPYVWQLVEEENDAHFLA
ncbi:MAG: molecular chaperone TorD family protein [Planctomycetes bacterium]|nr:molecular chaperone TorD family protein [Planctomycetota bacterium]